MGSSVRFIAASSEPVCPTRLTELRETRTRVFTSQEATPRGGNKKAPSLHPIELMLSIETTPSDNKSHFHAIYYAVSTPYAFNKNKAGTHSFELLKTLKLERLTETTYADNNVTLK